MNISTAIALRYMKSRRKERFVSLITLISMGGIGLGVAALIIVLAVLSGFETNLKDKFLGLNSHIILKFADTGMGDWPNILKETEKLRGIKSAEAVIYGQALASGPGGSSGLLIKGLDPKATSFQEQFKNIKTSDMALDLFTHPEDLEAPPVILGRDLALSLGVSEYSLVTIISPFGRITPLGARAPLSRVYQVAGTMATGLYEVDSNMAFMDLTEAQSLFALEGKISAIEYKVDDIYQAGQIKENILTHLGDFGFWARDWTEMYFSLFAALKMERTAMFVILALIILVAAFNVVTALIMLVMEKTRDIAILKSMGATAKQIRKIFTVQGMLVGSIGTFGGLVLGLVLCFLLKHYEFIKLPPEIYLMNTLPVEVRPEYIILTVLVALLISFVATLYPSHQAAKMDPVEALRYE